MTISIIPRLAESLAKDVELTGSTYVTKPMMEHITRGMDIIINSDFFADLADELAKHHLNMNSLHGVHYITPPMDIGFS